jgi:hypothetical protein
MSLGPRGTGAVAVVEAIKQNEKMVREKKRALAYGP